VDDDVILDMMDTVAACHYWSSITAVMCIASAPAARYWVLSVLEEGGHKNHLIPSCKWCTIFMFVVLVVEISTLAVS